MRKNQRLSVLLLFLLVPASITRAQTVNLTGTVSIERDYRVVNFNSPKGNVKVILPGHLSGPGQGAVLLSGTVTAAPAGKTEKEKTSNLKALQKMLLSIGSKSISILPVQNHFDFSRPANLTTPVPIDLVDPKGDRATVTLKNLVVSPPPITGTLAPGQPAIFTDQKVFLTNDNIPVFAANNTSTLFQPTDKFFIQDVSGKLTPVTIVAQSPTQTVLSSEGMQPGATTLVRQSADRTDQVNVRMANLTLTSPNTNLRNGQTSTFTVTVDPKITDKDSAEAMQIPIMSLDIKNLTPNVIDLAGGNYQVMTFPSGPNPVNTAYWQTTRTITGVTPGNFNVSATLYPSAENTSPVHSQLNEINTADEFNKWVKAIKKDLTAYLKELPLEDFTRRDIVQHVTDQMPSAISDADLEVARMEASYLLRYLPTFSNNLAGEGFAAFQTYLSCSDRLINSGPKNGWPLHVDVIRNGLNFIQNQNLHPVNATIQQQVTSALQATSAVQQDYSAKNIAELSTVLMNLNSTPFVTGLADVPAILYPHILKTDGPIGATMSGHEVTPDEKVVRFYDDGAIIIYANKIRYIFYATTADGSSLKALMMEYDDPAYPMPPLVDCDSLKRICKKTQALSVFWGNVYSVVQGKTESLVLNGVTKEKASQTSLLITRGWEMDCCTGEFKLKLFFQSLGNAESISFSKTLSSGWGYPCPLPDDCPECIKKCKEDKEMREGH